MKVSLVSVRGRVFLEHASVGIVRILATFAVFGAVLGLAVFPASAAYRQGSKPAPYLPTTVAGTPTTTLVVAPGRVVIDGKGFGHGVGMAQDGAFWMGKAGKSATQIMKHFFPGTTLGKQGGAVRVPLGGVGSAVVSFPDGGMVGDVKVPPGRSVRVLSGSGVVSAVVGPASGSPGSPSSIAALPEQIGGGGRFGVPLDPTPAPTVPLPLNPPGPNVSGPVAEPAPSTAPGGATGVEPTIPAAPAAPAQPGLSPQDPPVTIPSSAQTPAAPPATALTLTASTVRLSARPGSVLGYGGKRYRGSLDFISGSSGMRVVNELDVEWYLRGMAEVTDPSWPAAALQSQAIAARTYALRMMSTRGEVCPTQACQVYVGAQAEYPAMNQAVDKTRGVVVLYKGSLANTFYSASGGGTIAEPSEVFGPGEPIAYLKAGTYVTGDPKAWRVELSLAELGRRVGYPGTLYNALVSKVGPSGRAVEVSFVGSSGERTLTGPRFDAVLGLRSNNFRLVVGRSASQQPFPTFPPGQGPGGIGPSELDPVVESGSPLDFQSGLLDTPSAAGADLVTLPSTLPNSLPSTLPSTLPPTVRDVVPASVPAESLPTSLAAEASAGPAAGALLEQAALGEPQGSDSPESGPFPTWVGGAMLGGSGLGLGWLALRWALRPEGSGAAPVQRPSSKKR
jgi:SpoIID/LytB domain protein